MDYKKEALKYHREPVPGKIAIQLTKKCDTQDELSMAYTPGVAGPCLEIEKNPQNANIYTNKKNLVAVISNGTAVLGLGDIGALASKPVMEGKAVLFKKFAGIDVFDIEVNENNADKFIEIVKSMEPTFGGINLEDIKAPECFYIEEKLKEIMNIPVFHDDQHGTAVIATAGLINAIKLNNKKPENMKLIISGAGAAAISTVKMFMKIGITKENIYMYDTKGFIYKGRENTNEYKAQFAYYDYDIPMEKTIENADIFLGLSVKGILKPEYLKKMSDSPIVFALANPDPEIDYNQAIKIRQDIIMATGRSDYPNQINNVLGFPFIFRGALDCGAKKITENMKLSASYALAELARRNVPDYVKEIYNEDLHFSNNYIIPKPFDKRVYVEESYAVLKAAIEEKINTIDINIGEYKKQLEKNLEIGV